MKIHGSHLHAPDAQQLEKKRILATIKESAKVNRDSPRRLIADSIGNLTMATAAIMPTTKSMNRMIARVRNQNQYPKNPNNLEELVLNESFTQTTKGENFLLYDSGSDAKRLLMFATAENLQFLSTCDSIYMDGTFDIAPPLFSQVYTISTV